MNTTHNINLKPADATPVATVQSWLEAPCHGRSSDFVQALAEGHAR